MRRQIVLERGEEIRIELELKVVIVFGVVISLRAHAEPIHSYPSIKLASCLVYA